MLVLYGADISNFVSQNTQNASVKFEVKEYGKWELTDGRKSNNPQSFSVFRSNVLEPKPKLSQRPIRWEESNTRSQYSRAKNAWFVQVFFIWLVVKMARVFWTNYVAKKIKTKAISMTYDSQFKIVLLHFSFASWVSQKKPLSLAMLFKRHSDTEKHFLGNAKSCMVQKILWTRERTFYPITSNCIAQLYGTPQK